MDIRCAVSQRRIDLARPQLTPAGPFTTVWAVDVELEVGGHRGRGMARAFAQAQADLVEDAARALLRDARVLTSLGSAAPGRARLATWGHLWPQLEAASASGVALTALAGVDDAVWDLARHEAATAGERPRPTTSSSVYWSGLWLHSTLEELVAEARWATAQGFDGVKVRLDGGAVGPSIDRARAVCSVAPPGRSVALELAGSGTAETTLELVAGLDPARLLWVEDPLPTGEAGALRDLVGQLAVDVGIGEDCWRTAALEARIVATGAALPIVDLGLVGGPTAMLRLLAAGACGRDQLGVHIDALSGATVAALAPGRTHVWLEVFDWWGAPRVQDVRRRAAGR